MRPPGRAGIRASVLTLTAVQVALAAPVPSLAQGSVQVRSDIPFATHGGIELLLDAYVPAGEGPFPAVVVIPGGRWANIDRTKHADVPAYFAEHGVAAFAIDYRSALEFPYPAAVDDVTAGIRWVRGHAAEFDVDATRLGAIGVSAGGHLAALVGSMGSGPTDRGARVRVVASWSGPMDLASLVDSEDEELRGAVRGFLGCSDSEPCEEVARAASPITYVDPTDPSMVLINSDEEIIPVAQATGMAAALTEAGVENDVRIVTGGHGAGYGGGNKVLDLVIPFVRAWLDGRPAPEQPEGEVGAEDAATGKGGDGTAAAVPSAIPSGEPASNPGASATAVRTGTTSAVVVAIALVASVLVAVQLFVIARLRRRVADLSGPRSSPGTEGT